MSTVNQAKPMTMAVDKILHNSGARPSGQEPSRVNNADNTIRYRIERKLEANHHNLEHQENNTKQEKSPRHNHPENLQIKTTP